MMAKSPKPSGVGTGEPPGALREEETIHQNGTRSGSSSAGFMALVAKAQFALRSLGNTSR
jgi:hypothetical protein